MPVSHSLTARCIYRYGYMQYIDITKHGDEKAFCVHKGKCDRNTQIYLLKIIGLHMGDIYITTLNIHEC